MAARSTLKKKGASVSLRERLTSHRAQNAYVFLGCALVLAAVMCLAVTPKRYDLKAGDIAHTTITASKDVVDEISTEEKRAAAAAQVEPTYVFKEDVTETVLSDLSALLSEAQSVQRYGKSILEASGGGPALFTEEQFKFARSRMSSLTLADYQLRTLLSSTDEEIADMCENMTAAVTNTMNTTVRAGYVNDSIQYLQQIIGYKTDIDLLQNVVTPILRKVIQPNMVEDVEATEKLREEARAAVEPVIYKQGQNIVLARERVTASQLAVLRDLGLLDDETIDLAMYAGAVLSVGIAMAMLFLSLRFFSNSTFVRPRKLLILMIILCLTVGLCALVHTYNDYLMPVLLGVMLATCLLGAREAVTLIPSEVLLVNVILLGGTSVTAAANIAILFITMISGLVAIVLLRRKPYRMQLLIGGFAAALCNALILIVVSFLTDASLSVVFRNCLLSVGGAVGSAALCIALEPIADAVFHLATPAKLMELSNPNHPLLRRLMIEAPGSYHHSIIVGNLAEAAAEAIGANPLLARAGAYFHDIGKLKRPLYFKENQMGENPHERTNPYVSAAILTAHTHDGLELAQQYHLPDEILAVIEEHHGDTPVMFFYHKALQDAGGDGVDIADFRYDGRRPQSRESAIIMLADTVEAAVRSMSDPTPEKIRAFIDKLVQAKLDDGQLSEAPITLADIGRSCDAFATVLNGAFHERIEYPDISPAAAARVSAANAAPAGNAAPEEARHEN